MENNESKRQYDNELHVLKDIKKLHNSKGMASSLIYIPTFILNRLP